MSALSWNSLRTRLFSLFSLSNSLRLRSSQSISPQSSNTQFPESNGKSTLNDINRNRIDAAAVHVRPHWKAPRLPVVLGHGLFGFDKIGPESWPQFQIHYWRGIAEAMRDVGANVYVARVPRTGDVTERAQVLREALELRFPGQQLNLVGHSMGGLDARYLASKLPPSKFEIKSITTISTPHRGSSFMDWISENIGVGICQTSPDTATVVVDTAAKATLANFLLSNPLLARVVKLLDTPAYRNLTTRFANDVFNPSTPDNPNIKYFSYGASYNLPYYSPLRIPYEIISKREGPNDGLVSVKSAQWGQYLGTVPTDHWGLNNRWISSRINPNFNAIEFYLELGTGLWRQGF